MSNDFHFQMAVQRKIPSVYTEIPITCTAILKLKCLLMKIKFSVITPKMSEIRTEFQHFS